MFNPNNNGKDLIQLIPHVIRHVKPIMLGGWWTGIELGNLTEMER